MTTPIENFICFNFYTGWREVDQFYKQVLGNDISPQITYVLQLCHRKTDTTVKQIANDMNLNSSAVSSLIARMEKNNLVERIHDLKDRRVVNVRLTEEGVKLKNRLKGKIKKLEAMISSGINEQELNTLKKIVNSVTQSRISNHN